MANSSSELSSPPPETGATSPDLTDFRAPPPSEVTTTAIASRKREAEQVTSSVKRIKRATGDPQLEHIEESETKEVYPLSKPAPEQQSQARKSKRVAASQEDKTTPEVKTSVKSSTNSTPKEPAQKAKTKAKVSVEDKVETKVQPEADGTELKQVKRKRKTKEEKALEAMPLAARTVGSKLFIGAHVSAAGGVHNAITNCLHIGGNAFALFLKSQRKWANPPLAQDHVKLFKASCDTHKYDNAHHVVPHGSYLVNLCHTDATRTKQAYDSFLDDLSRCRELGIKLYNFHPGNCASSSREEALQHLATQLNRAHEDPLSGDVITLLETMAVTGGNTIGGTFEELKAVIDLVEHKDRVGVCLDTCHVFAAGYDLRTPDSFKATLDKFDDTIGLRFLKALHINDSKAPLNSCRDLHANIGTGCLGLRAFHNIMNEPRLHGLPMVLETPIDVPNPDDPKGKKIDDKGVWAREIKMLEELIGMDVEGDDFKKLEMELQEQGKSERERVQDQVDRREEKKKAKGNKGGKKGAGGRKAKDDGSESSSGFSEAGDE
ncbi:uncharacterized protein K452DRAFT_261560 [Aplosporella prunicola CBS 121167]|uniref:Apurinic-apyrimidinic endonuclease 1 n=1 Tax=Aplosporella prunicola CBS 121167 TaxID=1176127 RepID=A0A6A6BTU0_9PEZI|nr:uncharacterized protein K452DRAFT_261560 [Aplosporella prunicola CBS 121167]KAF2147228.1 hypothetical protein K452DRAFT_261560 [Aplosporella prunicola CBS 121167]